MKTDQWQLGYKVEIFFFFFESELIVVRVGDGELKYDSQVSVLGNWGHCHISYLKKEKSKLRKKLLEVILDKLYLIYVKHMIKRAKIQDPNTRTKFDIL